MADYVLKKVVNIKYFSLPPHEPLRAPHTPYRCMQVPQTPPWNTISNVEAAQLRGSSIEWAAAFK